MTSQVVHPCQECEIGKIAGIFRGLRVSILQRYGGTIAVNQMPRSDKISEFCNWSPSSQRSISGEIYNNGFRYLNPNPILNKNTKSLVLFGTNRAVYESKYLTFLTRKRGDKLALGIAAIVSTGNPETDENPYSSNTRSIAAARLLDISEFDSTIFDKCPKIDNSAQTALFYIHGFNNNVPDALLQAEEIRVKTKFAGPTFAYLWPSANELGKYDYDRESVLASRTQFRWYLERIVMNLNSREL